MCKPVGYVVVIYTVNIRIFLVVCVQHGESAGFAEEGPSCSFHSGPNPDFFIIRTKNQLGCPQTHCSRSCYVFSHWQWGNTLDHNETMVKVGSACSEFTPLCSCLASSFGRRCVATRSCVKNCASAGSTWSPWWLNTRGAVESGILLAGLTTKTAWLRPRKLSAGMKGMRHIVPGASYELLALF